jgi:monoamine oxidase
VTVSNGVLDSGMIEFTPPLKKRQEVVHGIPLARYSTVGLKFSRSKIVSTPTNAWLHALDDNDKHIAWAGNIGGSGVLRANIHGQAAEDLEQEGKAALIDHVTVKLKNLLGGDKLPKLMKADTYLWSVDPHILGTWSAASPGFGNKRKQLRYSYGKRVHFAGEACHKDMYSTCHGAMLSGATTAAKISKIL